MKSHWHVATAAEAFAAAQFARFGWDVNIQYGPNQPGYDFVAVFGSTNLLVSVKGSKDGSWGLTQSHMKSANYHGAVDDWLQKHIDVSVFCFVQFKNVGLDELPRMYLATPVEIATRLKETRRGLGDSVLYEKHIWAKPSPAAGSEDRIPPHWKFTQERLDELVASLNFHS